MDGHGERSRKETQRFESSTTEMQCRIQCTYFILYYACISFHVEMERRRRKNNEALSCHVSQSVHHQKNEEHTVLRQEQRLKWSEATRRRLRWVDNTDSTTALLLLLPTTNGNLSGGSTASFCRFFKRKKKLIWWDEKDEDDDYDDMHV